MGASLRSSAAALGTRGGRAGVGASKRRGDSAFYRRLVSLRKDRQPAGGGMVHRHLDHQDFTPAAIDDVISNGKWDDWVNLRSALRRDPRMRDRILKVCEAHMHDPYAQRHHFWWNYAKQTASAS